MHCSTTDYTENMWRFSICSKIIANYSWIKWNQFGLWCLCTRWMYQNSVVLSAKNASATSCTKWPSTRSPRSVKLLREDVVTTENNKVLVVKLSPSSERRYVRSGCILSQHTKLNVPCYLTSRQRQQRKLCCVWNVLNANIASKHHWNAANISNWVVIRSVRVKWFNSKRIASPYFNIQPLLFYWRSCENHCFTWNLSNKMGELSWRKLKFTTSKRVCFIPFCDLQRIFIYMFVFIQEILNSKLIGCPRKWFLRANHSFHFNYSVSETEATPSSSNAFGLLQWQQHIG